MICEPLLVSGRGAGVGFQRIAMPLTRAALSRGWILALIGMWTWAVGPVAFAEARCRIEPTADVI